MLSRGIVQPSGRVLACQQVRPLSRGLPVRNTATSQSRVLIQDSETYKELSTTYNPEELVAFFEKRPVLVASRMLQVATSAVAFYVQQRIRKNMGQASTAETDKLEGEEVKRMLAALGPTFVKLGQTLSTREDIIGKKYTRALADLQVSAPPFDDELAMKVIARELQRDPQDAFRHFNEDHIAAASLGQVYRGRTWADGQLVAVKVQRPDMLGTIALDVYVLRLILQAVRKVARVNSDLRFIADEVGRGLFSELNYLNEARQAALFARVHAHLPYIHATEVVESLTTSRLITTKWIDGVCPTDLLEIVESAPGTTRAERARVQLVEMVNMGVECTLSQVLETGIMHADPHPGNLLMMRDGRLAYLDFGLLTYVPAKSSKAMMACLVHVALGEWRAMADDLGEMGMLKDSVDRGALAAALAEEVIKVWPLAGSFSASSFLPDGSARQGGLLYDRIQSGSVRPELGLGQGLSFGKLAKAIITLAIKFKFHLPPYYTLMVRSLCTLEGLALRVDPNFSIVECSIPIVLRRLLTDTRPAAVNLLRELLLEGGTKLRIGMLEGLLRNYSAEAGKAMTRSPAANVVLKGAPTREPPRPPYVVTNAPAAVAMAPSLSTWPSTSVGGASPSGAAPAGPSTGARDAAGSTTTQLPLIAATASVQAAERATASGNGLPLGALDTNSSGNVSVRPPATTGASAMQAWVAASEEAAAPQTRCDLPEEAPAADEASMVAQMVSMVLSAKAAGVRRVLLEADMPDIVEQVAKDEAAPIRTRAAEALAQVISWRLIASTIVQVLAQGLAMLRRKVIGFAGLKKAKYQPLGKGIKAGPITLNGAALKRAQLVSRVGLYRLWQQSWRATLTSMLIGLRIVVQAFEIRDARRRGKVA